MSTNSKPYVISLFDEQRNLAKQLGCAVADAGGDTEPVTNNIVRQWMLTVP